MFRRPFVSSRLPLPPKSPHSLLSHRRKERSGSHCSLARFPFSRPARVAQFLPLPVKRRPTPTRQLLQSSSRRRPRQSRLLFRNPFPRALSSPLLWFPGEEREKRGQPDGRTEEMCPLRFILIFLSATVAGFFLVRGLNADPADHLDADAETDGKGSPRAPVPLHSKVGSAVKTGFWTMVDMASGRYLWRTLVAQLAKSDSDKAR